MHYLLYHIWILHQTTTGLRKNATCPGCIIFGFYIKPQLPKSQRHERRVVSYLDSTSNHNRTLFVQRPRQVVSYLDSTSNHNGREHRRSDQQLYHIRILHQTTTRWCIAWPRSTLYHIRILHQTTTRQALARFTVLLYHIRILHQTTTGDGASEKWHLLYHIRILHQTTTGGNSVSWIASCIILGFYIKPQPWGGGSRTGSVVSY